MKGEPSFELHSFPIVLEQATDSTSELVRPLVNRHALEYFLVLRVERIQLNPEFIPKTIELLRIPVHDGIVHLQCQAPNVPPPLGTFPGNVPCLDLVPRNRPGPKARKPGNQQRDEPIVHRPKWYRGLAAPSSSVVLVDHPRQPLHFVELFGEPSFHRRSAADRQFVTLHTVRAVVRGKVRDTRYGPASAIVVGLQPVPAGLGLPHDGLDNGVMG